MKLFVPTLLGLLATACMHAPTSTVTRPEIRGTNGCTRVVPPDVRPQARFNTRVTIDMNEWCEKIADFTRLASNAI